LSAFLPYDEKALLFQLAAGDEEAFASVYRHYQGALDHFLTRFVKSPQLAEDLSQEIFLKIWEQREKLSELLSFRAFLFTVARNYTLNILHKAGRSQAAMGEITRHALSQHAQSQTEDVVLSREYQEFLDRVIQNLPPRAREVFRLCRQQQLSYEEVAAQLGISRNSVKNHMVHSMKVLRTSVERDLQIPLSLFLLILYGR
jgi:RNA polymerase sigma-70 factor (ECF subfamily)